jgi:hypothetical protein
VTAQAQLLSALGRIAAATSVIRTRADDAARLERNGGSAADMRVRVEAVIERLEKVAAELEATLG